MHTRITAALPSRMTNALRIAYGYSVTVHNAQGGSGPWFLWIPPEQSAIGSMT